MKWAVEIQKSSLERRNLSDLLEGLGFKLVKGIDFDAFTSPLINECNTASEVWLIAEWLREAFRGPTKIDSEFALGSVIDYSTIEPRRHHFLEPAHLTTGAPTLGKPTLATPPPSGLAEDQLAKWRTERVELEYQVKLEAQRQKLEPAFWSSRASKVLKLLAIEKHTGETLYKIYELMEGTSNRSNRSNFHERFAISEEEFKRFTDTVHNPAVTGDWARHAIEGKPKTDNPMSIPEAERFVRHLADRWMALVRANKSD